MKRTAGDFASVAVPQRAAARVAERNIRVANELEAEEEKANTSEVKNAEAEESDGACSAFEEDSPAEAVDDDAKNITRLRRQNQQRFSHKKRIAAKREEEQLEVSRRGRQCQMCSAPYSKELGSHAFTWGHRHNHTRAMNPKRQAISKLISRSITMQRLKEEWQFVWLFCASCHKKYDLYMVPDARRQFDRDHTSPELKHLL